MKVDTERPFCGRGIAFDTEIGSATHLLPTCATYIESEDALDFILKVNEKLREKKETV